MRKPRPYAMHESKFEEQGEVLLKTEKKRGLLCVCNQRGLSAKCKPPMFAVERVRVRRDDEMVVFEVRG